MGASLRASEGRAHFMFEKGLLPMVTVDVALAGRRGRFQRDPSIAVLQTRSVNHRRSLSFKHPRAPTELSRHKAVAEPANICTLQQRLCTCVNVTTWISTLNLDLLTAHTPPKASSLHAVDPKGPCALCHRPRAAAAKIPTQSRSNSQTYTPERGTGQGTRAQPRDG